MQNLIILSITVWPLFVAAIVSFVLMLGVVIYQSYTEKKILANIESRNNTMKFIENLNPTCDLALYLSQINNAKSTEELDMLDDRSFTYYNQVKNRIGEEQALQDMHSIDICVTNKRKAFSTKAISYN